MSTPPIPQTTVSQSGMLSRSPGAKNLPSRPMMMPAMITPMMSIAIPFTDWGRPGSLTLRESPSGRGFNHRTTEFADSCSWVGGRELRERLAGLPGLEPGTSSLSGFCPRACCRRMAPATCANDLPLEIVGDRYEPLGSDGMWTKRGPSLARREGCLVCPAADAFAPLLVSVVSSLIVPSWVQV